ncbi:MULTISPECIES: helix-turn-helix domain-containing protein [unclassified Undibacterium]|uniref:helix-turn-helix domain-containing protein n=1 Tax=unclassified Undibacterium TaxID=2630295 RepID=UPI00164C1B00|nr:MULTISPECIES: helix-turn-helix domain-containing protein [unclassified Undibacterium]MBC3878048.1 helix-turn-helix domain-containing protein [Undibacterium sp. FT79W]MBC3928992.1 helix-turn-helix domain-containing protein [Undibacterium sp. CY21W]
MSTPQAPKKSTLPTDWHRADIVAALHKKGWSLRALSLQSNLGASTVKEALNRPYPKAERIIAAAIGVAPEEIWPERYAKRNFTPVLTLSSPNSSQPLQCAA